MARIETQESISIWAEEAFGRAGSNARLAGRANEEMAELIRAATSDRPRARADRGSGRCCDHPLSDGRAERF